jgi:hypothetical protein
MGRLRRRATIARKGIVQILETAGDYALEGEEWGTPRGAAGPAEYSEAPDSTLPLPDRPALSPLERKEFDFADIDDWMRQADQAILRTKAVLDQLATAGRPATPGSNALD